MPGSAVRHLALTDEPTGLVAAQCDETVAVWSWKTGLPLFRFQGVLGPGGRQLALTPDGSTCVVGAFGRRGGDLRGLAAYSLPDGRPMWNRYDLRDVGNIRLSGCGREIYCHVGTSTQIVETATGMPMGSIRSAEEIVCSSYTPHRLVRRTRRAPRDRSKPSVVRERPYLVRGETKLEIPAWSFSLLDAAFSPDAICLSEPRDRSGRERVGGIRLIDLTTGEQRWHLDLGSHCLTFNAADSRFYCVACTEDPPYTYSLIRLADDLLACDQVLDLGSCSHAAFSPSGRVLATGAGDVYETSSGSLLEKIDFP